MLLGFRVGAGETASVSLSQWDAWPDTAQDFDEYVERRVRKQGGGQRGRQNGTVATIRDESVSHEHDR